jgi:hypothetical protein
LNQHVPPERTPAAQPDFARHNEQQISFVAAGADSRLPCPKSHCGVKVHAVEAQAAPTNVTRIANFIGKAICEMLERDLKKRGGALVFFSQGCLRAAQGCLGIPTQSS